MKVKIKLASAWKGSGRNGRGFYAARLPLDDDSFSLYCEKVDLWRLLAEERGPGTVFRVCGAAANKSQTSGSSQTASADILPIGGAAAPLL